MQGRVITSPHYQGGSLAAPSHGCDPEQVSGEGVDPGNAENGGAWTVDASPPPPPTSRRVSVVGSACADMRSGHGNVRVRGARGTRIFVSSAILGRQGCFPINHSNATFPFITGLFLLKRGRQLKAR